MNNFFQFLRRHTTTIIFIILEALALALVFTGNDYHRAAYLSSANVVTGSINRLTSSVGKYFALATANESLAEQNLALQQEVAALRAQLMAVPDSVWPDIPLQAQQPSLRYHAAKVIGSSTNRSRNMITIDRGAANGVKQDMAVINPQGVVGLVAVFHVRRLVRRMCLFLRIFICAVLRRKVCIFAHGKEKGLFDAKI